MKIVENRREKIIIKTRKTKPFAIKLLCLNLLKYSEVKVFHDFKILTKGVSHWVISFKIIFYILKQALKGMSF